MNQRNIEAIYQLSPAQQEMLFHSPIESKSSVNIEHVWCILNGKLELGALEQAWQKAVDRHAILRTSFAWEKLDQVFQVVHSRVRLPFEYHDWRCLNPAEVSMRLDSFLAEDRARGFDITKAPLLRFSLIYLGTNHYCFVLTAHQALLDRWSVPLLFQDVYAFYDAYCRGEKLELPPPLPYRDYISHLQKRDEQFFFNANAYWRRVLDGAKAPTTVAGEKTKITDAKGYATQTFMLSGETTRALQTFAQSQQLTLAALVLGAWAVLLHRLTHATDILFGLTVPGRPAELPGVETIVGRFANILPLRVCVSPDKPVSDLLQSLHAQQGEMREYESYPLADAQGPSDLPPGQSLFSSVIVFENLPFNAFISGRCNEIIVGEVHTFEPTNYALTVVVTPGEQMKLNITYNLALFDQTAIERMCEQLTTLFASISANPSTLIAELPMQTGTEQASDWAVRQAGMKILLPSTLQEMVRYQLLNVQLDSSLKFIELTFNQLCVAYNEIIACANHPCIG